MKITHNKLGRNLDVSDSAKSDKTKQAGFDQTFDKSSALSDIGSSSKVNLSSRAQKINKAKEIANSVPDVDEAKVARLQKLIDEGKYKVDASAIADKMIDEQGSWE